ncbi:ATPase [Actinomycetota bacterium]|nr:ATPase [Actinomycetota bacterium]
MLGQKEVLREQYLEKLRIAKDTDFIKVITGARRCGKSTLLRQFQEEIARDDADSVNIISLNLEEVEFDFINNYNDLYYFIKDKMSNSKQNFIFIDEIQGVKEFERAVDSLYVKKNVDLYITGSNSKMLSSELATLLTGRYIEIEMLPLSFSEYLEIGTGELPKLFEQFLEFGGFPAVAMQNSEDLKDLALRSLYATSIIKDIETRMPQLEINKLERFVDFIFNNIGNTVSALNVANTMTTNGDKISDKTIGGYLTELSNCFILYPAERYDIKGKRLLRNSKKYYLVDQGIRRATKSRAPRADLGHALENVVFLELKRRFDRVWIGKVDDNEVDFAVSDNDGNVQYIQVAYSAMDENTMARELKPFKKIRDNQQKILLSLDINRPQNYDGIRHINVIDWLLGKTIF